MPHLVFTYFLLNLFPSGPDVSLQSYGSGSGEVLFQNIGCEGHESNILLCQHSGIGRNNCSHDLDVGINCGASKCHILLI